MTDERADLLATAIIAKEIDLFWSSTVGKYLRGRAQVVYSAAIDQLKICDPTDAKEVIKLQGQARNSEYLTKWIEEIIGEGLRATRILEGYDDETPE